jgi:myo-inositol-1(or 4)-monophosphatase
MTSSDAGARRAPPLCERLATEAGAIARDGRAAISADGSFAGTTKSSSTDVVTEYDRAAEAHIVGELRRLRPDDAIVGEEGTDDEGTSGFAWFIDPIDGTTNFVYDQPSWSCSVAVAHRRRMVAGAVSVPPLGELFSAAAGLGATRNGDADPRQRCDRSVARARRHRLLVRPDDDASRRPSVAGLIDRVRDIRRLGSAAVDLCMVACGRLDVYYERHLNSWDAAAGELIAREAGATTSDFRGGPARPAELLATTPALHAPTIALLRDA